MAHNVNVPVLRKALEHITAHPEEWRQHSWAVQEAGCGTAYCLAGTIAVQQGYELDFEPVVLLDSRDHAEVRAQMASCTKDGQRIAEVAAREAGLPTYDIRSSGVGHIFSGFNSLSDLWRMANTLTDGEIEIPAGLED
jgi:L-asparaginase II